MNPDVSRRIQLESLLNDRFPGIRPTQQKGELAPIPTGVAPFDAVYGGILRGALTEITGSMCSGRSSLLLSVLARLTRQQEVCALIDASDTFDPASAVAAGVDPERLLWIRIHGSRDRKSSRGTRTKRDANNPATEVLERAIKTADLIVQSKGFGLVALDLAALPAEAVRRVPLTSWFRFRRVVENTRTALLVLECEPHAKTCASLVLKLRLKKARWRSALSETSDASDWPSHTKLLDALSTEITVLGFRGQRGPNSRDLSNSISWLIGTEWSPMSVESARTDANADAEFSQTTKRSFPFDEDKTVEA